MLHPHEIISGYFIFLAFGISYSMIASSLPANLKPCPICGKMPQQASCLPFCSERCEKVDLNRWLSGVYAIPAVESDADEEDALESEPDNFSG
jgi:endogenous inhibitor of DNA gyrase (YacG/DUF329 family)